MSFCTTASTSLSSRKAEEGRVKSKRARVEISAAAASTLIIESAALPTCEDPCKGLQHKAGIVISELPNALAISSRKKGKMQSKRVLVEVHVAASSSIVENAALPTRKELYEGLQCKVRVLISELPKALTALSRIQGELLAKLPSIRLTNYLRMSGFTGIIACVQTIENSIQSTILLVSKDCSHSDKVLGIVAFAVIGSGELKDQLMKFSTVVANNVDTQDIDCSILRDVSASIHGITKDIVDPFQENFI